MCGIYGYKGITNNGANIVLAGLKNLDYRGYDSWGITVIENGKTVTEKDIGKIESIKKTVLPKARLALGHTRWATTGKVTKINAHPLSSTDLTFSLVQNGIVENYLPLKSGLIKDGFSFESETDTEVIVRLIEKYRLTTNNLIEAIRTAFNQLQGRNTIAVIDGQNNRIIAAKNGSPLILGKDKMNNYYLSSDIFSLAKRATSYFEMNNGEMLILEKTPKVTEVKSRKIIHKTWTDLNLKSISGSRGKYRHYMLKEIFDTPEAINQIIKIEKKSILEAALKIKKAGMVYTIGSGTAGNAAAQIAYYLRKYANIQAISLIGADAGEYFHLFSSQDVIIAPSQSGETADVLQVLDFAKTKGMTIISLVNMPGSMISRISDDKFLANAGVEICVLSTKVFVSQITFGYLIAKTVAGNYDQAIDKLKYLSIKINKYLNTKNNHQQINKIANLLVKSKDILLIGKGQNWQIAREGMVKLIEGSYKHAHAIPAGDLKHYAITLIEKGIVVIALVSDDDNRSDLNSAINQINSRGGSIVGISSQLQYNFDYWCLVPETNETSAIINVIPLQLLAYYMAVKLGNNVDKPRNIAKSVTVK